MKKLLLPFCIIFLTTISSRADLVWYEGFNYADGATTNASAGVWRIHSTGGSVGTPVGNDSFIRSKRLEISGNSSTNAPRQSDINRPFYTTSGGGATNGIQLIYASFTVNCTNLPTSVQNYFAHFNGANNQQGRIFNAAGTLPSTWRLGITGAGTSPINVFPADLARDKDYQVVVGWNPTASTVDGIPATTARLWVNPVDANSASIDSGDGVTTPVTATAYSFRQASGSTSFFVAVSNCAVATTFSEAATNVWTTNATAPVIVRFSPSVTNFSGENVFLSGLAAGQGQGNLTYTWLKDGGIYTNPDGNTNALNIFGAQPSDSGNYQLVATTPFSLSATSAVAQVWVTNAPVPPAFVTQPVSQSVFTGQTVVFSTTVISPGNVIYQWKSNNVDLIGENGPTLTLNNVTPDFSGSQYRVGVTNDVVPNGILSTNATLTVTDPQTVSIAYLRTLVDPVTLQAPPNSTTPYKVAGTITTFTNITSGNTASYYLQDGTAGINIFATFGGSFRPSQGDNVTFVGVVSSFSSGLELFADTVNRPYTSYAINSSGNPLPTPIAIPFNLTNAYSFPFIATNLAGSLVKLSGVYFGTNAGTTISTTGNQTIAVTNSSGQLFYLTFFNFDGDTAGQTLPVFASSVTGVLYGNHPNYSVGVTKFSDIDASAPVTPIPLNYTVSGGSLTFNWSDATFELQSSTNVTGPYTTISGAATGFTTNTIFPQMYFRLAHP